jgi:hypothetical protein
MQRTLRLRHSKQLFVPSLSRFDGRSLDMVFGVCMIAVSSKPPSWTD